MTMYSRHWIALFLCVLLSPLVLSSSTRSKRPKPKTLTSSKVTGAKLRYVVDSGVCETTPGVRQMSGYLDVGENMSMWFWFFESRDQPEKAPFTLWLNGGPGCSSMIGLFQENGPCTVNADAKTTKLNPYSWNSISNMIYIDQPIGTGFSYGVDTVDSTVSAAPFVWKAFQVLFESPEFSKYKSREFIFSTESYGGHYAPAFIDYFDYQNSLIEHGKSTAEKIMISALMINNGWFDPLIQFKSVIDFTANAPGYGPLQPESTIKQVTAAFVDRGGCKDQLEECYKTGSDNICMNADDYCNTKVFNPAVGNYDVDDLRQSANAAEIFPYEYYVNFLQSEDVMAKIGAEAVYAECPNGPYNLFVKTGDDARNFLPALSNLVRGGLKTLIWAGDADINCNWLGGYASVLAMDWPSGTRAISKMPFANMSIEGKPVAAIKNYENFSFARVFEAGHEVPAFQPRAALEIFKQIVHSEPLHSV